MTRSAPLLLTLASQVQEVTGRCPEPEPLHSLVLPRLQLPPVLDGMLLGMTGPPPPDKERRLSGVLPMLPPKALSGKCRSKHGLVFACYTVSCGTKRKKLWSLLVICVEPKVLGLDMRFTRERYPAALLSLEFQGESPVLSTLKWVCLTAAPPLSCMVCGIIE